jgi:TRAP transporter TAXI family solute receptor
MSGFSIFERFLLLLLVSLLAACAQKPPAMASGKPVPLVLSTGATGGTFVEYGDKLAQLLSKATPTPVTTLHSGGSLDNLRCLSNRQCDMALVAMASAFEAWNGLQWTQGKPLKGYAAMLPMYETPFHLATTSESRITMFAQLAGRKVGVGPRGGANELIFKAMAQELSPQPELVYGTPTEMASGVINGSVQAFFFGAGVPVPAYQQIAANKTVVFIPVDGQARDAALKAFPYLTVTAIPAGAYKNQLQPVPTIGLWNFLLVRDGLPDDVVYAMTKATLTQSNLASIVHATASQTTAGNLKANTFLPVHPGAAKFYREIGVSVRPPSP